MNQENQYKHAYWTSNAWTLADFRHLLPCRESYQPPGIGKNSRLTVFPRTVSGGWLISFQWGPLPLSRE